MKNEKLLWVMVVVLAAGLALCGCDKLKRKPAEEAISVETPPGEEAVPTAEEAEAPPEAPKYAPAKLDVLKMLYDTLGASEKNLGWDNIFTSISLDKNVELFTMLQDHYAAGSKDRTFIDDATAELSNINIFLEEKMAKAEGVDPTGDEATGKKKIIRDIRTRVKAMMASPAPAKKEPVPEWKGDLQKKKWDERGEMMKKKWAERGK
jgi:hypothetical protein